MNKITKEDFQEIRLWMYRNARHLDLTIWQNLFENGSKEAVISALAFYQNSDGGFGNALEADNWNPNSSPYSTLCAINILDNICFNDISHPIMQGILRFLESGAYCNDNGWLFSTPSNNDYAHAPWWTYDTKANEVESIGVTAGIVSFIIRYADSNSGIYKKALDLAAGLFEKLEKQDNFGDMGIEGCCVLLDTVKQAGLANQYDCDNVLRILRELVYNSIERDTSKWVYYGVRPSNYIQSPSGVFYKDNEDIVQAELDYLVKTRPKNGVWGITWTWFDNNEKYAKEFTISENWWKANKAIEKMMFLRNFNRVE